MGGEKRHSSTYKKAPRGSPPRGRGKVHAFTLLPTGRGITPAWAGKSILSVQRDCPLGDHPRVGGEKVLNIWIGYRRKGSPPRGRGKDLQADVKRNSGGITPAWAGKRKRSLPVAQRIGDHPRVGGEKPHRPRNPFSNAGSPPRGRGKALPSWKLPTDSGITPAWAGKSLEVFYDSRKGKDHPRVGGEKIQPTRLSSYLLGSPPRGRGKGPNHGAGNRLVRITPAWAGKSALGRVEHPAGPDHPRVGGEKITKQEDTDAE